MNYQKIQKSVLKTMAWFSLFDRPLTFLELHQYLYGAKTTREDLKTVLARLNKAKIITQKNKLFFLAGRRGLVNAWRKGRYWRRKKMAVLKKEVTPLLLRAPFLKFIGITGSVAFGTAQKSSDIDLFIITQPGRVWTTRFFINLFLDQKKLRDPKSDNMICVNMLAPKDNLNFKAYFPKTYDKYYLSTMIPVFGAGYDLIFKENQFVKRSFPNHRFQAGDIPLPRSGVRNILELIFAGKLGDRFEEFAFRRQRKHIRKNTKKFGNEAVAIKKNLAKIHFVSLGNKYEKRYRGLVKKIVG